MTNRCTIEIDCDRMTASMSVDTLSSVRIAAPVETTQAMLIGELLQPKIKELMQLTKDELRALRIAMLSDAKC